MELRAAIPKGSRAQKSVHTTPGELYQVKRLQAKFKGLDTAIIFGQHSNQEAQSREDMQQEISKQKGPLWPSRFFEKEVAQTPCNNSGR